VLIVRMNPLAPVETTPAPGIFVDSRREPTHRAGMQETHKNGEWSPVRAFLCFIELRSAITVRENPSNS